MPGESIPLIDFSPFLVDNEGVLAGQEATPGQQHVAEAIDKVCREHGFLCLINFGMSTELRDKVFAESAQLFDMSQQDKDKLVRIKPTTNTGYAPFKSEKINRSRPPELKEAFNLRYPPKWNNDLTGCPPSFGPFVIDSILPIYKDLAHRYAFACALALKIPTDYIAKTLTDYDLTTLRMLHYPSCDWEDTAVDPGDVTKPIRIGEHTGT